MVECPVSENSRKGLRLTKKFSCGKQDHREKTKRPHRSQEINSQPGTHGTSCHLKQRPRKKFPAQESGSTCPRETESQEELPVREAPFVQKVLETAAQNPKDRNLCFLCCNGPSQSPGAGVPDQLGVKTEVSNVCAWGPRREAQGSRDEADSTRVAASSRLKNELLWHL